MNTEYTADLYVIYIWWPIAVLFRLIDVNANANYECCLYFMASLVENQDKIDDTKCYVDQTYTQIHIHKNRFKPIQIEAID